MTGWDVPEIDETLASLVEVIDKMSPPKSEGPGVILTLAPCERQGDSALEVVR